MDCTKPCAPKIKTHLRSTITLLVLSLVCTLSAPIATAKKLEKEWWHKIESPNFTLYSLLDVEQSKSILHDLELLRAAIPKLTNIRTDQFSVPIDIVIVRSGRDFSRFSAYNYDPGYSLSNLRMNTIIARESTLQPVKNTVLNEYVHLVLSSTGPNIYPSWVTEGLAQYFETARIADNRLLIGAIPTNLTDISRNCTSEKFHGYIRNQVSISHFMGADSLLRKRIGFESGYFPDWPTCNFWFESWAMIHYLFSLEDMNERLEQYRLSIESGNSLKGAVAGTLGTDSESFLKTVREYVNQERLPLKTINVGGFSSTIEIKSSIARKEHIALKLGQLAMNLDRRRNAIRWFKIAGRDKTVQAAAESGLGFIYLKEQNFKKALPHYKNAVEIAPSDANVQLDMGFYWFSLALSESNEERAAQHLKTAREHFGAAWKLNDKLPEVYALYGTSLRLQKKYKESLDTLETAHHIMPKDMRLRLDLASVYGRLGQFDEALVLIHSVITWSHRESALHKQAEELLERVTLEKKNRPESG